LGSLNHEDIVKGFSCNRSDKTRTNATNYLKTLHSWVRGISSIVCLFF